MLDGLIKYFNKSLMESVDLSWFSWVMSGFLSLISTLLWPILNYGSNV
jgi:hypothetical protein